MCRLLILKIHTDTEMISSAAHWFTSVLGTVNREYSERKTEKKEWHDFTLWVVHLHNYQYSIQILWTIMKILKKL